MEELSKDLKLHGLAHGLQTFLDSTEPRTPQALLDSFWQDEPPSWAGILPFMGTVIKPLRTMAPW